MHYVLVLSLQGASHSSIASPHTYMGYGVFTAAIQRVCVCISNTVPDNDSLIKHVKIFYLTCIFHTCEQWQCQLEKCSDDDGDDDDDSDDDGDDDGDDDDGDDNSSDDDDNDYDDGEDDDDDDHNDDNSTDYYINVFCPLVCE